MAHQHILHERLRNDPILPKFRSQKMKMLYGLGADSEVNSRSTWLENIVIHPDDRPRFDAAFQDHFDGLTPWYECEYRVRQPDGDWHWLLARGRCLRDSTGKPVRILGSAIDVNAQKLAQAHKEQLEAQLRQSQKMEAIGTLAGGIAHDFNNILGARLGYGELAQQHSAEGGPLRRYLDNVMHAAERAQILVERILGFSRSGLGNRAPVNVKFVVEETLELLEPALPAGIRLESRIESANSAVIGDATYFHQVVMNLCTNAIQAMEHGGTLCVFLERVEVNESRTLTRGLIHPGSYVRLTVRDTGVGVTPAVVERMFDPFFTTKGVGEGTGLGLATCHGIIKQSGGHIAVYSEPGRGTTFKIYLPQAEPEKKGPAGPKPPSNLPRGTETVLLVEDDPSLRDMAATLLTRLGYNVVVAANGVEAMNLAHQRGMRHIDLLFTDVVMPQMSGKELAERICALHPHTKVLFTSAYTENAIVNQGVLNQGVTFLQKPFTPSALAHKVRVMLDARLDAGQLEVVA